MAPVTLPPSFYNSFWSSDYRSGLEALFRELDKGSKEATDLADFIESQVEGHHALAKSLFQSPSSPSQSTSSLQHTLAALKSGSSARGEAHRALALELESRILIGFNQWRERHADRLTDARKEVLGKNGVVGQWEKEYKVLKTLQTAYATKARAADDSEDDAKFATAPVAPPTISASTSGASVGLRSPDSYTASPKPKSAVLQRSGTVADRISEKLRAASISSPLSPNAKRHPTLSIDGKNLPAPPTPLAGTPDGARSPTSPSSPREDAFIPPSDPNGKPSFGPPVPEKENGQSTAILLSGLSLPASGLKDLLNRFDAYLLSTPAPFSDASSTITSKSNAALASRHRTTILGTYEKTFSGEEVTEWLKSNVEGFGGDWERSIDAARELHSMGHLSRVGVGRGFEAQDDIYYVLRTNPEANAAPYTAKISSQAAAALKDMPTLSPATSANIQNMIKTYVPARFAPSDEPLYIRLRREAGVADEKYRDAVQVAEAHRLQMEERIERGLRIWERWERERLAVFQQVLKQYDDALAKLPARLREVQKSTQLSVETYNPDADLRTLIEGNRTGPFRPQPHVYESLEADLPEVNFGIDLRKWAGDTGWKAAAQVPKREKGAIPDVLSGMLKALDHFEQGDDSEKRKAWIYEVPLPEIHALRNSLNHTDLTAQDVAEVCAKFNAPVVAGAVKLYLLELNPPLLGWEGWEDAKAIYPSVGADQERDMTSAVTSVLGRLPGAQLYVLDAVVGHLRRLIDNTKTDETEEVYTTKLALSLGRCILRPSVENDLSIGDRTPQLFFADLLTMYSAILPALVEKKKQEAERVMPVRKRTALVDQRPSRRNISEDDTPQALFERTHHITPSSSGKEVAQVGLGLTEGQGEQKTDDGDANAKGLDKGKGKERAVESPPPVPAQASAAVSTVALAPASAPVQPTQPPQAAQASPTDLAPPIPAGIPRMADPQDSDDEAEPPFTPPTDTSNSTSVPTSVSANSGAPQLPPIEGESAMDDILESYADAEDQPISGAGSGGLKRATSGDAAAAAASRLRGPRAARGPRPAGGRSIGGMTGVNDEEGSGRSSPQPGISRSRPGHATKGSVSAMAARFEQTQ